MNRPASNNPPLMMFQVLKKRLDVIVGGGNIWDAIPGEQTPAAMAHALDDVSNDLGFIRVFKGLTG